jgi:UDP-4-amino-4,6-dideoxy-N-acetyl-beta-L-altrosamine transaminase
MQNKIIPYGRQTITSEDIEAVVLALKSDYLTQGPKINEFELKFAEYVGSNFAIAVSNGTAALHLCALALDVKPGDKVITSPITFVASANCIEYCGGTVEFVDIDPETYLLDIKKVRKLLEESPKGAFSGIIPVEFAGRVVNLEEFRNLADEFGLWIIEDACHAPGGYFQDKCGKIQYSGNGSFADLSIFSFHPVKHIASGEGGMITTNDKKLYDKLVMLRTHGITREFSMFENNIDFAVGITKEKDLVSKEYPLWYMEMQVLGFNYRLTDFQAALGSSQLNRAEEGLQIRREIAKRYQIAFANASFIKGQSGIVEGHAYHLYIIEVEDRLGLYNYLREQNIYAQIHYIPVHLMPYYRKKGWKENDFPYAESYYKRCISLPMFPSLTESDQKFVVQTIFNYYNK